MSGTLNFVCDALRKKQGFSLHSSSSSSSLIKTKRIDQQVDSGDCRDEKICSLASELLLCDEDSLRRLSGQLLNEAEHLNQLDCVVSTLRKLRRKQFLTIAKDLERIDDLVDWVDVEDPNTCEHEDAVVDSGQATVSTLDAYMDHVMTCKPLY